MTALYVFHLDTDTATESVGQSCSFDNLSEVVIVSSSDQKMNPRKKFKSEHVPSDISEKDLEILEVKPGRVKRDVQIISIEKPSCANEDIKILKVLPGSKCSKQFYFYSGKSLKAKFGLCSKLYSLFSGPNDARKDNAEVIEIQDDDGGT